MIKAVFFDLYGTLAGFRPSRYEVQSQARAAFGIKLTHEGVLNGYALADAYMSKENARNPLRLLDSEVREKVYTEYERLVLKGAGVDVSPEQATQIWKRIRHIQYGLALFDDVAPNLSELRHKGLKIGMISNMDKDGDKLALVLGLAPYIDISVTSLEAGVEKPHPGIFHLALTKAGVQACEAMHVGDQPMSDIEGAMGAGIQPVLLDRDGVHKDFSLCPRIETLSELHSLIDATL